MGRTCRRAGEVELAPIGAERLNGSWGVRVLMKRKTCGLIALAVTSRSGCSFSMCFWRADTTWTGRRGTHRSIALARQWLSG